MSIVKSLRSIAFAASAAAALGAAAPASAQTVAAVVGVGNWVFGAAGLVPIPAMTTPVFFNGAGQRFVVIFSSECAVDAAAGNTAAYTDVDIVVLDPFGALVATLPPTAGNQDAFCAANGTAGFDGWENNAITALGGLNLPAGNYMVQVRARLNNAATGGWFGERMLTLMR
jgi:hypothetical protein